MQGVCNTGQLMSLLVLSLSADVQSWEGFVEELIKVRNSKEDTVVILVSVEVSKYVDKKA